MDQQSLEAQLADLQARLASLERQKRRRWRVLLVSALLATAAVAAPVTMVQFTANTPAVATQINQNFNNLNTRIEEVNTTLQTVIAARTPQGTIAFFAAACPSGWTPYAAAAGRFIVGNPAAGLAGRTVGPGPLADNVEPRHMHVWAWFGPDAAWWTHDVNGNAVTMIDWSDGMDSAGSGNYPIALDVIPGGGNWDAHTQMKTSNLPYIQLNACVRGI